MKTKLAMCFVLIAFIMVGCATTDNHSVVTAVEEIAARNLGYQIAKNDVDLAGKIIVYMDGMEGMDDDMLMAATEMGIGYLVNRIEDDPGTASMMREDAMTLIKLFGLNSDKVDLSGINIERVKPILSAFRKGVEIGLM